MPTASWRLIDSGPGEAADNMALDEAIARAVQDGAAPATLRLYGWSRPAVSLGAFQRFSDVDTAYCAEQRIPIVRRPTGGRGILHGDELTYSFSSKNEGPFSKGLLDTYRRLAGAFRDALALIGLAVDTQVERERSGQTARSPLCFRSASFGELLHGGRKMIGAAQKRWSRGFLQQGSIPYSFDYERLERVFTTAGVEPAGAPVWSGMVGLKELIPGFDPGEFARSLGRAFESAFGVSLVASLPTVQELEAARALREEKYLQARWTEGRAEQGRF